ncbi:MAG TPA: hypothetical protein PKD76_12455 [Solirubrobacterales bacterium]|nr:hypothetical protein [Solirubrobacterales bacterium]
MEDKTIAPFLEKTPNDLIDDLFERIDEIGISTGKCISCCSGCASISRLVKKDRYVWFWHDAPDGWSDEDSEDADLYYYDSFYYFTQGETSKRIFLNHKGISAEDWEALERAAIRIGLGFKVPESPSECAVIELR